MQITTNNGVLSVYHNEKLVLKHSKESPFVSALEQNIKYKSSHGSFKVNAKIKEKIPLTNATISKDNAGIEFSGENVKLSLKFYEKDNTLYCDMRTESNLGFSFCFPSEKNEAFFGGGEQYRKLNMKGEKIINFVSEHIKVKPIVQKTVLKMFPYKEKDHKDISTYSPMSTYVSSNKYALRFDIDSYGVADFTADNVSVFSFEECPKNFVYVSGECFKEIGKKLNANIPNNERLPDWAYDGMILGVQGGIDRAIAKVGDMQKANAAICGVWCQDWSGKKVTAVGSQVYWNWEVDEKTYSNLMERVNELHNKGVRFLAYINPYLVKDGKMYNYCKDNGYLIKNNLGEVYHIKSTTFDAGMMDLTHPQMVEYLKETIIKKNMLDLGIDGYMADFGEYLPTDSVLHAGDATKLHNMWPTLWAKINREAIESHERSAEIFFFTRSGYNGAQSHTSIMWNGDQHTDFSKDYGMGCVLPATFNLGFSGMTAVHSDIGGFISFGSLKRDDELFVRWTESNVFSPLLRSHETIKPEQNAQPYDPSILPMVAKLSLLHKELKPYLMDCMAQANEGIPVMRPDFYNSNDYANHKDTYSFMLGDEVFVAPVIERGATTRKVSLPEGEWIRLFEGKCFQGGSDYTVDAPLGYPVAFYLSGGKYQSLFDSIKL